MRQMTGFFKASLQEAYNTFSITQRRPIRFIPSTHFDIQFQACTA